MANKLTSEQIVQKIAQTKQIKADRNALKKAIREEQHNEWAKYNSEYESVYVFRAPMNLGVIDSLINNGYDPDDFIFRPVTVVGVVKKEEDGSHTLQIGWSQCSAYDTYDRKTGNLIAIRRAVNPDVPFSTTHGIDVYPMVIEGFNSKFVKRNFIKIASLIIDEYEDAVNRYTYEPIDRNAGILFSIHHSAYVVDDAEGDYDYEEVAD